MMTRIKHLYIHVPFCNSICNYCDFCHRVYDNDLVEKWLLTLQKEISEKCNDQYETIYIGGGTPTCLSTLQLEKLLCLIKSYTEEVIEYTIEVNPESLDDEKIKLFRRYGINRVSMGVQTSDNKLLQSLNRKHTFEDVMRKIELLKQNDINNISIDLMYSLPNQSIENLNKTIDDFIKLDIPHVSLYSLTIEENTVFGKKRIEKLDDDTEADMYELICNRLKENGYIHYEVSNFCKPGYESKHNLGYWNYEDFLGLSLGASSKVGNKRWTNTFNFNKYFDNYNRKDEELDLDKEDLMFENIMMSLRTIYGLNIKEFNERYSIDFINKYKEAIEDDNVVIENEWVKVKNLGILNRTLLKFMEK